MTISAKFKAWAPHLEAWGRYIEQPQVIRNVGVKALGIGSIGGVAALAGADYYHAQPEERKKTMIRDGLVLGSTLVGTAAATKWMMPLPVEKDMKQAVEYIRNNLSELLKTADGKQYQGELNSLVTRLQGKTEIAKADFYKIITTIEKNPDLEKAKNHLKEIFEEKEDEEIAKLPFWKRTWREMMQDPNPEMGREEGEGKKMLHFFTVGGLSVISGLLGGIAANKINGVKDKDATVNMVKEGIFQFVANIALCAVGASAAIVAMSPKKIAEKLESMGWKGKLLKTAGIGAGLSLGIFGGGVIANKLGTKVINPICDKIQGKEPQPQTDPNQGKRKIEFWDAILHLDDVPTAMALAGMEIVEPFIPLFFGFSGYRTGIGYRNDDAAKATKGGAKPEQAGNPADLPEADIPAQVAMPTQPGANAEPWSAQANPFKPAMQSGWQYQPLMQPQSAEQTTQQMPMAAPAA